MRVGIVTTSYPESAEDPSGHFVRTEAVALAAAGHEVVVFAPRRAASLVSGSPSVEGIASGSAFGWPGALPRLRERPLRALGIAAFVTGATKALRARGPFDRVIAHFVLPSAWPIAVSGAGNAELEIVVHGSDLRLLRALPRPLRAHVLARLRERVRQVRCVSAELYSTLERLDPELARRARVEASPIDLSGVPSRSEARLMLGLDARRVVLVVARLVADKRVSVALSAGMLVPGTRLVVIGSGPELARLRAKVPSAEFLGRLSRSETLTWIAAADVVLCASALEGAPTVVREARALGTPVVAVQAGDLAERAAGDPGLLVVR